MIELKQLASAVHQYFWQNKLLLVQSLTEGQQLLEALIREGIAWANLRPITPLELALEMIQPDMQQRGLERIEPDQLLFMLNEIIAGLERRGEIVYFRQLLETGVLTQVIVKSITELRLTEVEAATLSPEQLGDPQKAREMGLILNAYDLELESRGLMDDAAVFQRANGLLLTGTNLLSEKVIIIPEKLPLSTIANHFVSQLKKHSGIILWENPL
ncbi:MAG TPA: hypothetical protein VN426_12075 [Syntrophomonadaceae bacterium]|nr:hypothetical protein [Syntrophomonadaceae bacterium]